MVLSRRLTRSGGSNPASQRPCCSAPRSEPEEFWRQLKRANVWRRRASLVLALPLVALFGVLDGYIAPEAKTQLWLIRFGIFTPAIAAALVATVLRPFHAWSEFGVLLGVFVSGGCLTAMTLIAPAHYAGILLLVFATYTFLGLRFFHAGAAGVAVSALYIVSALVEDSTPWPALVTQMFFLAACNAIGAFVCYALEQAARRDFLRTRALSRQQRLSERLLHNVLPTSIVHRLKSHFGSIADTYPDVTILFADIVDFTPYAAAVAPARAFELLDRVFTCFDRLADQRGLEKIKTIGDAYMVAGGLGARSDVRAVAEMAFDMLDCIGYFDPGDGRRLTLRIGIHTGPVVAGVIGRTKFAYDLWGDTVNVASRIEGLAAPGTIQVSESTYARLGDDYVFTPRRVMAVKGCGDLPCYRLLSRAATSRRPSRARAVPATRAARNALGVGFAPIARETPA